MGLQKATDRHVETPRMDPVVKAEELDTDFRIACAELKRDDPWHGAMMIEVRGLHRVYRIGKETHPNLRILSWQHPYARAFYEGLSGRRFELERDEADGYAPIAGRLDHRARVTARQRRLQRVEIECEDWTRTVVRDGETFVNLDAAHAAKIATHGLPEVLALLTPEQYRLITTSRDHPVILQGRAGSGKTTVALHRVAWLTHPDASPGDVPVDPSRVLVVMFNKALTSFVEGSLAPLGLQSVQLHTFHAWALGAIRRAYQGEIAPKVLKHEGREAAVALKRQVGILTALEAFVERQTKALFVWFEEKAAPYKPGPWIASLRDGGGPIVPRLVALRRSLMAARDGAPSSRERTRLDQLVVIARAAKERMTLYKDELLRLLSDQTLLKKHLTARDEELAALAAYQTALQGEGGTGRRPGPSVGFEDFALLLRLIQIKNGGLAAEDESVFLFDHLVIDEAQDFGAVELRTLLSAVRARTGVTIVGDLNQKIVPDADFIGWDALATEVGLGGAEVVRLEVPHRSTRPIVALAGTIAPDGAAAGRAGPTPKLLRVESEDAVATEVAAIAGAVLADGEGAHVCVVCGATAAAAALHARLVALMPGGPVRLGHNAAFSFGPGVTVTNLRQIKGLEFDAVIVVEPDDVTYPATEQGRRWLYTVVTRAKQALFAVASKEVTPLLDVARASGLLEVEDKADVPVVAMGEGDDEPF